MTSRAVIAGILLLAACSSNTSQQAPEPAPVTETKPPAGANAEVRGQLAASLAPPSSFVALELASGAEVPVKAEPAVMDQVSLVFYPALLLAQAGQTVEFRNGEDVLHNIRVTESAEQKPVFNVATPPFGKYEYKFEKPGSYEVGCDIHPTMRADILVTATPYTAVTAKDGTFTIGDVAPGAYKLMVYTGPAPVVRPVEVKSGATDLGVIQ